METNKSQKKITFVKNYKFPILSQMTQLNRKYQPDYKPVDHIEIIRAHNHCLDNGIPAYLINAGSQEVVRIDLIFGAGVIYQNSPLLASSANSLLIEGTDKLTSAAIAEQFDYYGAYINLEIEKHAAVVSLYTLNKYLNQTVTLLEQIIKYAAFPENEFHNYITQVRQGFIIESDKVDEMARRKFHKVMFGSEHPYGKIVELEDFDTITNHKIREFYQRFYKSQNCKIVVAGKIPENLLQILNKAFGGNDWKHELSNIFPAKKEVLPDSELNHYISKPDALQTAIRIGKLLFNRMHPDYIEMQVLNHILGGYFGSRLMTNIREEKAYTYSIGSALISYPDTGYLVIVTQIGNQFYRQTMNEIAHEINILQNELVSDNELNLVKNFMLGEVLKAFDGPFALIESYRILLDNNLDYNYFDQYIQTIKNTNPKHILELAQKYLDLDSMHKIIAGNFSNIQNFSSP